MANSSLGAGVQGAMRRLLRADEIGVIAGLVAMSLVLAFTTDSFTNRNNLLTVARQASDFGIMVVGMVFVLAMGDVDLSVGSTYGLVTIVAAICFREKLGVPVAISAGILCGLLCGAVNGILSIALRIPTIIVTLGTLSLYRGLTLVASSAAPVSQYSKTGFFFNLGGGIGGIPLGVIVMTLVGVAGHVLFRHTPFGWRVQAIGSNAQAAAYSGISLARHRIAVMTLMGLIAAVAAIVGLAFQQSGNPTTGEGFELKVIASTIIGGTALSGGSGTVPGAILGALMIAVIANGLTLHSVSAYWSTAVTGIVIIVAVAVGSFVKRRG